MDELIKMSRIDAFWGIPFLFLSIKTMKDFLEAFFQVYTGRYNKDRSKFVETISSGDFNKARSILSSSKDNILCSFKVTLMPYLRKESDDFSLKENIKGRLNCLTRRGIPNGKYLNAISCDILYVGFLGTIFSMIFLFSNFDLEVKEFSQIFLYMGSAMKSSAFGVAASFMVSRGMIFLQQRLEISNDAAKEFCSKLIGALPHKSKKQRLLLQRADSGV